LIKSDSKDIYNVTKDFYFKQVLFCSVRNVSQFPHKYSTQTAQLFSTLIITNWNFNVS